MESLNTAPWNVIVFSVLCFSASFLLYWMKDGLHLWLAAGFLVIPVGAWLAKINLLVAIAVFIASSIVSLLLFAWLADRIFDCDRERKQ